MKKLSETWIPKAMILPLVMLFGWFQGCSGSFTWPEHLKPLWVTGRTDVLRIGYMIDPGMHLPILDLVQESQLVNSLVHRAPLRRNADGSLTGDLWKDWTASEQDGRLVVEGTWDQAVWHDGQVFSPADFEFTLETIRASATQSPFSRLAADIINVEHAPDQTTTRLTFAHNSRRYLDFLCLNILPKHLLATGTLSDPDWIPATMTTLVWNRAVPASGTAKRLGYSFKQWPCGLGPYRIKDLRPGYYLHLERVPGPAEVAGTATQAIEPAFASVLVRYYYGAEDLVTDMRSQVLDWTHLPSEFAGRLQELGTPGWVFERWDNPGYTMLGLQTTKEPWSRREVREAIDHAIDRRQIVTMMPYEGVTAGVPPLMPDISRVGLDMREHDVAKARALLDQCELRDTNGDGKRDWQGKPLVMKILVNEDNLLRKMLAEALVPMLKNVGLMAEVEAIDWSEMIEKRLATGTFDAFVLGFHAPLDGNWINLWHSNPPVGERLNFTGFTSPDLDRILEARDRAAPLERSASDAAEIARILYQQAPGVFLFSPREVTAVRQGLATGTADLDWLKANAAIRVKN